jgi:hypothetical protein
MVKVASAPENPGEDAGENPESASE